MTFEQPAAASQARSSTAYLPHRFGSACTIESSLRYVLFPKGNVHRSLFAICEVLGNCGKRTCFSDRPDALQGPRSLHELYLLVKILSGSFHW